MANLVFRRDKLSNDGSAANADVQEKCVNVALREGLIGAAWSLAISSVVVLGAVRLSPSFAKSLSVSGKTALIVTPPFGAFFLKGELAMNDCAQRHRYQALKDKNDQEKT